ncbi:MAG: hypothetical protein C0478_06800 [Planctomyces sp.]|nr:hypothetical protein [Planctomyces sp.]
MEEPVDWNQVLADPITGWKDELPEPLRTTIPFEVGPQIFGDLPSDVILCPNAEHHSMTDNSGHFNALGSYFASGTFDVRNKYRLIDHGYPMGCSLPWKDAAQRIFDKLQFPDGGGLTINHPIWSGMNLSQVCQMLDHDPRVLGIEIWNQTCDQLNKKGWALDLWDDILRTGRRCYGFSVSDHAQSSDPNFLGYNRLLIPQNTADSEREHACLKAYRNGRFYCVRTGRLELRSLHFRDNTLTLQLNHKARIKVVTATGIQNESEADSIQMSWSESDRAERKYVRVEAWGLDDEEALFTQPVFFA